MSRDFVHTPRRPGFLSDDEGASAIEFSLWFPLVMVMFFSLVDASILFFTHARMSDTARAAAREMSVGGLAINDAALDEFVKNRIGPGYTSDVSFGTTRSFTVSITGKAAEMGAFGVVSLATTKLNATVTGKIEPAHGR